MRQRSRRLFDCPHATTPYSLRTHSQPTKTRRHCCVRTFTHARTHTSVCSGPRRSLCPKLQAPPRCAASTTAPSHSATGNRRHATDDVQDGTGNGQETTCDRERACCNVQRDERRRGSGDRQRTPCNTRALGRATENRQRRTCDMQQRKGTQTRSNGQQCRRRPLENVQQTIDNMHHASGKM